MYKLKRTNFLTVYKSGMGEINRGGLPDLDPDLSKNRGGLPDPDPDLSKNRGGLSPTFKIPRQFEESRGQSRLSPTLG